MIDYKKLVLFELWMARILTWSSIAIFILIAVTSNKFNYVLIGAACIGLSAMIYFKTKLK